MSLRGHLEDLGVGEILHVVGAARRSGLLHLDAGEASADILFRDGAVVALRGAGMPATMAELLVAAGVLDDETRRKAEASAAEAGGSVDAALKGMGVSTGFRAQQALEAEIERRLPKLLTVRTGRFEFSLLAETTSAADFGAQVLETGVAVSRLGASRGRARIAPDSPSETTGARRARLLMAEDRIALPGAPPSMLPGPSAAAPTPARAADSAARRAPEEGRTVLHCLQSGPLRQRLLAGLAEAHCGALAVTSLGELVAGVEAARSRGESVALACAAGHPDLPGLELLARLRSIDVSAPALLLLDPTWLPARQAAATSRAEGLGVRVLALVADGAAAEEAGADLAARLLALVSADARIAGPPVAPGEAATDLGIPSEAPPQRRRLDESRLAILARGLAAAGETADVARELLAVAGDHHDHALLLVREADGAVEPLGLLQPASGGRGGLPGRRAIPADAEDVLARVLRSGMAVDGPPPAEPGDAAALAYLGAAGSARVTLLPLLASGACFGVLACDSEPGSPSVPDLASLSRFVMETSPALWEALARERRRGETRRLRTGA